MLPYDRHRIPDWRHGDQFAVPKPQNYFSQLTLIKRYSFSCMIL